jgi:tetratricopeptide (TPR) repeat protein
MGSIRPYLSGRIIALACAIIAVAAGGLFWAARDGTVNPWHFLNLDDEHHFAVLVANIEDDVDGRWTRQLASNLTQQFAATIGGSHIDVLRQDEVLTLDPSLDAARAAPLAAAAKGRQWLLERNANVLIWGRIEGGDQLHLRVLNFRSGANEKHYWLSGQFQTGAELSDGAGEALAMQAAVAIETRHGSRQSRRLAKILLPLVAKLSGLSENPPAALSSNGRAIVWNAYAEGAVRLGEETGDNGYLSTGIAYFNKALTVWTEESAPQEWARTQNNLGNALAVLGAREKGTAKLQEAVRAFRQTLRQWPREREPLSWGKTQVNIGTALLSIGERETGADHLREAVVAFSEALTERPRSRVPLDWAAIQNNLGTALLMLGERDHSPQHLEAAVAAYHHALAEWTRARLRMNWARTQENLGAALMALGQHEHNPARVEAAVTAFRAAQAEWRRDKPPHWIRTQKRLGQALLWLGERQPDTRRLEEAVAIFRAGLDERNHDRVPLQWASMKASLSRALWKLGKRQKNLATLREARREAANAVEVFAMLKAAGHEAEARQTLTGIDQTIKDLK